MTSQSIAFEFNFLYLRFDLLMIAAMTVQDLAYDLITIEPPLLLETDEYIGPKSQIRLIRCLCDGQLPRSDQCTVLRSCIIKSSAPR